MLESLAAVSADHESVDAHAVVESTDHPPITESAGSENPVGGGEQVLTVATTPRSISDIRLLYVLQDRSAHGDREAVQLQKRLLPQIARELASDLDQTKPSARAQDVTGYVLSGGDPSVAERLSTSQFLSGQDRNLLTGAAHYMRGKRQEAAKAMSSIDPLLLQPSVAGRVALAKAILATDDPESQQKLLSIAIAAMPGTLVEESALRRSAAIYARASDQKNFWKRSHRYQRRFPDSVHAAEFFLALMENAVTLEAGKTKLDHAEIDLFLTTVPVARRRVLYLALARSAALKNLEELTAFAARRLQRLSLPGSQEEQLGLLYLSLFSVVSSESAAATERLQALDGRLFAGQDLALLEAARTIAVEIHRPAVDVGPTEAAIEDVKSSDLNVAVEAELQNANKVIAQVTQ